METEGKQNASASFRPLQIPMDHIRYLFVDSHNLFFRVFVFFSRPALGWLGLFIINFQTFRSHHFPSSRKQSVGVGRPNFVRVFTCVIETLYSLLKKQKQIGTFFVPLVRLEFKKKIRRDSIRIWNCLSAAGNVLPLDNGLLAGRDPSTANNTLFSFYIIIQPSVWCF
jgi:hypothetical protein